MCNCYQQYLLFCLRITSPLVLNLVRSHHLLYSLSQFCTNIGVSGCGWFCVWLKRSTIRYHDDCNVVLIRHSCYQGKLSVQKRVGSNSLPISGHQIWHTLGCGKSAGMETRDKVHCKVCCLSPR